jgi:serine protease AprX
VVGAVDVNNTIAFFSSRGPVLVDNSKRVKPDCTAGGVNILSSYPTNNFVTLSGTCL